MTITELEEKEKRERAAALKNAERLKGRMEDALGKFLDQKEKHACRRLRDPNAWKVLQARSLRSVCGRLKLIITDEPDAPVAAAEKVIEAAKAALKARVGKVAEEVVPFRREKAEARVRENFEPEPQLCELLLSALDDEADVRLVPVPEYQPEAVEAPPVAPVEWLLSWAEITAAVGRENTDSQQRRISRLSKLRGGPIIPAEKRGAQPKADRAKLLEWWRGLGDSYSVKKATQQARPERAKGTPGERVFDGAIGFGQVKNNQRSTGHVRKKMAKGR